MRETTKQTILGAIILIVIIFVVMTARYIGKPTPQPEAAAEAADTTIVTPRLSHFDPNTADYRTLTEAGVPREVAVSIIRWREAGKVYRIKEDIALCYGITDSVYFLLEPYIIISEEHRIQPKREYTPKEYHTERKQDTTIEPTPFSLDTASVDYLRALGFTRRQAELVKRYGEMIGGYRSIEEFAECYAVDSAMAERLRPYIIFPKRDTLAIVMPKREEITLPININTADSATLRRVKGIGEKSVVDIMRYRELLGGYYSIEQILELSVVTEDNFRIISQQIYADSVDIKKININFASPKALEVHPYLSNRMLRQIINKRELKGGWSTIQEMIDDNIFTNQEAAKIAPYLDFGQNPR